MKLVNRQPTFENSLETAEIKAFDMSLVTFLMFSLLPFLLPASRKLAYSVAVFAGFVANILLNRKNFYAQDLRAPP
jgi:hypothetical protein